MNDPIEMRRAFRDRAIANGIKPATYYFRMSHGWTREEASTIPTGAKRNIPTIDGASPVRGKRRSSVEIAKDNGISMPTYYARVRAGWGLKKASTTPVRQRKKRTCSTDEAENMEQTSGYIVIGTTEPTEEEIKLWTLNNSLNRIWNALSLDEKEKMIKAMRMIAEEFFNFRQDEEEKAAMTV